MAITETTHALWVDDGGNQRFGAYPEDGSDTFIRNADNLGTILHGVTIQTTTIHIFELIEITRILKINCFGLRLN
jgi:hypothetical protein